VACNADAETEPVRQLFTTSHIVAGSVTNRSWGRHGPGTGMTTFYNRVPKWLILIVAMVAALTAIVVYLTATNDGEHGSAPRPTTTNGVTVSSTSLHRDRAGKIVLTVLGTARGVPSWQEIWATARSKQSAGSGRALQSWLVVPGARDGDSWRAQLYVPDPSYLPLLVVAAVTQAPVPVPSCPPHAVCDVAGLLARHGPRVAERQSARVLSPARLHR
jgi:hypothetical protein